MTISRTEITFENLSFYYSESDFPLIEGLSSKIPAGINAIVGPSGIGKSTLINIIMGFVKPTNGFVHFNLENSSSLFQPKISLVPQSPHIFHFGTLKNILLGTPISQESTEIASSLLSKCKLEFLNQDLLKFESEALQYQKLMNLSGGEKQRLCIARSIFHMTDLLIIDEGTNSLDISLEFDTLQLLKDLSKSLTVILISHSKQVMQSCDKIFWLDSSRRFSASGSFLELVNNCPEFRSFVREER